MTLSLKVRALLLKLLFENGDCELTSFKVFRTLKDFRSHPVSAGGLRKIVITPEETVYFGFVAGKRRIAIAVTSAERTD